MNLAEVMQLCSLGMRTGRIEYRFHAENGQIYCQKGNVIHAIFRSREGQDAVVDMLLQQDNDADFFDEDVSAVPASCLLSCTHLLLESARILDESKSQPQKNHRLVQITEEGAPLILEIAEDGQQLGRHESNAFLIAHHTISRHHCVFHLRNHVVFVSDLNSTNGTYVNDVLAEETPLIEGNVLRIGELFFRYELSNEPLVSASPSQAIPKIPLHQTTLIPSPIRHRPGASL